MVRNITSIGQASCPSVQAYEATPRPASQEAANQYKVLHHSPPCKQHILRTRSHAAAEISDACQ
jgi:hypothetical protein